MSTGLEIQKFTVFTEDVLAIISSLEAGVFNPPTSKNEIAAEAKNKTDLLILIAIVDGQPCGYKVGFQHSTKRFYSWIGGVLPEFRNRGVATALMMQQHALIKELGYKYVFTHTKNKFRSMLLLNIKNGFDVIGVRQNLGSPDQSIVLEKALG